LFAPRILRRVGGERWLPEFAREAMSLIPQELAPAPLRQLSPALGAPRGRVGFVSGCVMSVMFAKTNAVSVRLLNQAGYDVVTPTAQVCCGALFAHTGNLEAARRCARKNIETFETQKLDALIINAAGCGSTLKEYGVLLDNDPGWKERGKQFSSKVQDLTEFLVNTGVKFAPGHADPELRVTYHDACHLAHAQRI